MIYLNAIDAEQRDSSVFVQDENGPSDMALLPSMTRNFLRHKIGSIAAQKNVRLIATFLLLSSDIYVYIVRLHTGPKRPARRIAAERDTNVRLTSPPIHGDSFSIDDRTDLAHIQAEVPAALAHEPLVTAASPTTPGSSTILHSAGSDGMIPSPSSVDHLSHSHSSNYRYVPTKHLPVLSQRGPSWGGILHSLEPPQDQDRPLDGVQEACLLRYFVEELSHWVT